MSTTETRRPDSSVQQGPDAAPNTTPPWAIVTLREVMVKARDRSYLISTLVTLVLIVGAVVFNAYMANRGDDYAVAVTGTSGAAVVEAAGETAGTDDNTTFEAVTTDSPDAARELVSNGDADAALIQDADGAWTLVGNEEVDGGLRSALTEALRLTVLNDNAKAVGTTGTELLAGSELQEELLEGNAENALLATVVGFAFSFLFYMSAIIFGMAIANSVLEEKQNRVVEILATAIPIRQLLYGKVAGNTVLAMIQLALYGGAALLALNMTDTADMVGMIIPASGWFLVFFLAGFLILASAWAMLGAMASRNEDLSNSSTPVLAVVFAALFAGLFAKGQLLVIASFIPVVSSVAMPIRMLNTEVPLWETFLSLAVALAAAYALLRFSENIYRRAVMQSGGALTLRKAMKLES